MSSSWFHSSSSSSHLFHEVRSVRSYEPYFDDEDDVKPAVTQHWPRDYAYAGEDVKPAKQPRPFGGSRPVKDERRDGGVGAVEDVKPAKQPRPSGGAGRGSFGGVHDHQTVLSWPMVEQFKSTLRTQEALAGLRARYSIPEGFGLHLAGATQAACAPPPPPARGARGGAAAAVPICVHSQAFAAGMRLPLHPFVSDALTHFGIAPSQLAPNGWRTLVGFAVLCHFRSAGAPTLPVFRRFFALATLPNGKGWYSFRARENVPALFTGLPTSIKGWKEEFLLVSPPPGAPWRCPVKWGVPTKEAMSDPVLTESDAAVVRRLSQGQGVVDLKTFLSESNLVAAKISRAPACLGMNENI